MWGKYENIQVAAQNVANAGDGRHPIHQNSLKTIRKESRKSFHATEKIQFTIPGHIRIHPYP